MLSNHLGWCGYSGQSDSRFFEVMTCVSPSAEPPVMPGLRYYPLKRELRYGLARIQYKLFHAEQIHIKPLCADSLILFE